MTEVTPFRRLAIGLCLSGMLGIPASIQAQTFLQNPNTTTPIKHVVVIFQENVSFDHYFATYPLAANNTGTEPTFTAAAGTPSVNGLTSGLLTSNPNSAQPFRLTRAQAVVCDQDHNYADEQKAFNHGLMNKFVEFTGTGTGPFCSIPGFDNSLVMGYYDGNSVTAIWNYAQHFAMSDNSYETAFGPSTVGVLNLIAGNTHGATVTSGSAAGNVGAGGSVVGDPRPDISLDDCTLPKKTLITMSGKNIGDLLNAKGITWGFFQGGFKPSSRNADGTAVCATTHNNVSGASAGTDYIPHHQGFMYFPQTANPHHMPPTSPQMVGQTDAANHQYDLSDFTAALAVGNLPAVTYLKAAAYQDGHAGYSDPLDEQTFLVGTINAIEQSPFWKNTAIIIAYDDSDGFYDHVMSPIVKQSTSADDALTDTGACGDGSGAVYQGRCGYGPRLPLLVISPFAKSNFVDHTVTDQSSILRFIEDNFGLGQLGNDSYDAIAGPLTNMFNFTSAGGVTPALVLDPSTGEPATGGTGGGTGGGSQVTAVANPKGALATNTQYTLDGTQSKSSNGGALTYQWTVGAGSPSAVILYANTATPIVQFDGGAGLYSFVLTVTDSTGATATDTATISYNGGH